MVEDIAFIGVVVPFVWIGSIVKLFSIGVGYRTGVCVMALMV